MLRSYSILFFIAAMLALNSTAQTVTWEKLFVKKSTDAFRSVTEVPSGGYIAAGYTADSSTSDTNAFVVRLRPNGDTLWTRSINGPNSRKDLFYKVIVSGNGFALCGYSNSFGTTEDAYVAFLDANGNLVWENTFGTTGRDRAQEIAQTADGGYIVAGYVAPSGNYSGFLWKLDANGDSVWSKTYRFPGSFYSDFNSVKPLADGGFIATGQAIVGSNADVFLARTNSSGDTLWTRMLGYSTPNSNDNGECVIPVNGGFLISGGSGISANGTTDGYVLRTDTFGIKLWDRIYGVPDSLNDDFHQISPTFDGGYICAGTTRTIGPVDPNIWIMKMNSTGDSLWSKTFGGDNHDHGYSAVQTSDSGFIVAGYSSSFGFKAENAYVIKIDGSGNLANYLTYGKVDSVLAPINGSCVNNQEQVVLSLRNFGRDTLQNVPVFVVISNGTTSQTYNHLFAGPLYPADVKRDTLPFLIDLAPFGCSFSINAYTQVPNDLILDDNSTTVPLQVTPAPVGTGVSICGSGSITLSASSCGGQILWFDSQGSTTSLTSGNSFVTPNLVASTTYFVQTGTCAGIRTPITATIHPNPDATLGGGADTLNVIAPYTLNGPAGYTTYIWSNQSTGSSVTTSQSGLYCVTVIDTNGCFGSDCIYVNVATGIESPDNTAMVLFPNPASERIFITFDTFQEEASISIVSMDGRCVRELAVSRIEAGVTLPLQITDLSAGYYSLLIRTPDGISYSRFIKN